jgi:hypothetical protein
LTGKIALQNACKSIEAKPPGADGITRSEDPARSGKNGLSLNYKKYLTHQRDQNDMGVSFVFENKVAHIADG